MILKDVLGFSVDFALLDKSILKLRSSINFQNKNVALVDEGVESAMRDHNKELKEANSAFVSEIQAKIEELQMYVQSDCSGYGTVAGMHPDCCSLLS